MPDVPKLDAILGRAVRDSSFRQQLLDDPAGAAAGYDLSPEELQELKDMDKDTAASFFGSAGQVSAQMMKDWCTEKACNEGG